MVEQVYEGLQRQLSVYYTQFIFTVKGREKSENKIRNLIDILGFINRHYDEFDEEDLLLVRNICLISNQLLTKIDTYKSLKLHNKDTVKILLLSVNNKIKGSV